MPCLSYQADSLLRPKSAFGTCDGDTVVGAGARRVRVTASAEVDVRARAVTDE